MSTKVLNQKLRKKIKKINLGTLSWKIVRFILILGLAFIILYPIFYKVAMSFMSQEDLIDNTVQLISRNYSLRRTYYNYLEIWEFIDYPRAFINSLFQVSLVSLVQLFSCTLIGYGFARFDFKGKGFWFAMVILTLLVPPQMLMIPLYLNFRFFNLFGLLGTEGVNLLNSYWSLVLLGLTGMGIRNGLFIYIMRQYFRGMPKNLEEAAFVDGANALKTFFKVMLPGAIPAIVIVFLFSFVWQWNDDFYTTLFMPNATILVNSLRSLNRPYIFGGHLSRYNLMMKNIAMLMFITPLLVLFIALQRHFVESIQRTGIVG